MKNITDTEKTTLAEYVNVVPTTMVDKSIVDFSQLIAIIFNSYEEAERRKEEVKALPLKSIIITRFMDDHFADSKESFFED